MTCSCAISPAFPRIRSFQSPFCSGVCGKLGDRVLGPLLPQGDAKTRAQPGTGARPRDLSSRPAAVATRRNNAEA